MIHHASRDFWACYRSSPQDIQKLADEAFGRLKQDPRHPGLHFKKVGRFWSARVGGHHDSERWVGEPARLGLAGTLTTHWYEAHGIGRKEIKRKRYLD